MSDDSGLNEADVISDADPATPIERSAHHRRGRTAAVVAALTAGAVFVGGAGYLLGTSGNGSPQTAAGSGTGSGTTPLPSLGAPGARSGVAASDMMIYPYPNTRTVFSSSGLSSDPGQAQAWAFDAQSAFDRATIVRAAAALNVSGDPQQLNGSWFVGEPSGTKPSVQLSPDGWTSLSYYDPTVAQSGCAAPEATNTKDNPCAVATATPLTDSEATRRTRALLTDLGVDPTVVATVAIDVTSDGTGGAYVSAYQVIDGQRAGATWSLSWFGDQLTSVYGAMAPVVSLGSYDLVSPTDAVQRLSDPRFGQLWGGGPIPMGMAAADGVSMSAAPGGAMTGPNTTTSVVVPPDAAKPMSSGAGVAGATAKAEPDPTPPPTVVPGAPFGWPVQQVTITKARVVLVPYTLPSGAVVLLPGYELSDAHDGSWTVVGVVDSALDFSTS